MSILIENVIRQKQGKHTVYVFALSAKKLKELGVISRLHENEGGVQRRLDENRATDIAVAMRDPKNSWLDTMLVHLELDGSWEYDNGTIIGDDRFRLSIDDGQHRCYALTVLNDEELEALGEFTITAAAGLTFEERLSLFLQQEKRKHIHRHVILEGKNRIGDWNTPNEKAAYELVIALANDPRSPLVGRIELKEVVRATKTGDYHIARDNQKRPQILASGLHTTLKTVVGNHSLLYGMDPDRRKDILLHYLTMASKKVWKEEWENWEENILSNARGVNALLRLFVSSKVFRMILINDDFGDPRLYSVLILGSQFNWSITANKFSTDKELVEKIDTMMSRTYASRTKRREKDREK